MFLSPPFVCTWNKVAAVWQVKAAISEAGVPRLQTESRWNSF